MDLGLPPAFRQTLRKKLAAQARVSRCGNGSLMQQTQFSAPLRRTRQLFPRCVHHVEFHRILETHTAGFSLRRGKVWGAALRGQHADQDLMNGPIALPALHTRELETPWHD